MPAPDKGGELLSGGLKLMSIRSRGQKRSRRTGFNRRFERERMPARPPRRLRLVSLSTLGS